MSDEVRKGGIARRHRAVAVLAVGGFALSGAGLWAPPSCSHRRRLRRKPHLPNPTS
ncbi:hypothetical protein [Streptomyces sp. NBC_01285]|uniref:hypothetical protein n=1 Tax=Streptomyces sp. NBC_01285 TaxID=2903813 RepID=UPI00224D3F99|nr:hypothetical protein [Streptomyces sp. NBC_01285]MCX4772924.1 hypothetical protein [Streptomyces sp. NBC_01285]